MEQIISVLNRNISKKVIMDRKQIEIVINEMSKITGINISKIEFDNDEYTFLFGFNILDDSLVINDLEAYKYLLKYYKESKAYKITDFTTFLNLMYYFYFAHELQHGVQKYIQDISDKLKRLYKNSLEYQINAANDTIDDNIIGFSPKIIYKIKHDFFITEVNADINAYISLLNLISRIEIKNRDNIINFFNKLFIERLLKSYEIKGKRIVSKCEEFYISTLDSDFLSEDFLQLSEKERILHGLNVDVKTLEKIRKIEDMKEFM